MYALGRYFRVATTLIRLTAAIRFAAVRASIDRLFRRRREVPPAAVLLRRELERLGGVYVKFGQLMAMRADIIPPEYAIELSRLLDHAPPFDSGVAFAIIARELKREPAEIFASIDSEPLAAASFAQVYGAALSSGERVVVKVQRPEIRRQVNVDVKALRFVARLIDWSGFMRRLRVQPVVEDFAEWTLDELDYLTEATYAERMRHNSDTNPAEYIPTVYWDYSTSRVLTLERLEGVWLSGILAAIENRDEAKLTSFREQGVDLGEVARKIFFSGLHQAFEEELFHADPHAGNLVVLPGNVIGYIDFGIVGQLGDGFRDIQMALLLALQEARLDRYGETLMRLFNPPPENVDIEAFQELVKKNARRWLNNFYNPRTPLREKSSAYLITRNMNLARQFGLSFSHVAIRYYRALLIAELIVLRLDPEFNFREETRTFFIRYGFRQIAEQRRPPNVVQRAMRVRSILADAPERVIRLLDLAEREISTVRTAVNRFRLGVSRFLATAAVLGLLALIGWFVARLFFPNVTESLPRGRFLALLQNIPKSAMVVGIIVAAWLARLFSIYSIHRGKYVRLDRR